MNAALVAFLLAALAPLPAWGKDLDERMAVERGGVLEVHLDLGEGLRPDRGGLEVASHNLDEVRVVADASGWGSWGVEVQLHREGDVVRLDARVGGAVSWLFGGPHVQIRIWVPRDFSLDLHSFGGPIRIEDVRGAVRVRSRNAPVSVSSIEGPVRLRCSDGDVYISEVVGDVDVRSVAGSIQVRWITGDLEARTERGAIEVAHAVGSIAAKTDRGGIELREVSGPVEAKTERGDMFASFNAAPAGSLETRRGGVEVILPEGAGAQLDAHSRRGQVELSERLKVLGNRLGDRVTGPVNGGGALLRLYTARGGVRVTTR